MLLPYKEVEQQLFGTLQTSFQNFSSFLAYLKPRPGLCSRNVTLKKVDPQAANAEYLVKTQAALLHLSRVHSDFKSFLRSLIVDVGAQRDQVKTDAKTVKKAIKKSHASVVKVQRWYDKNFKKFSSEEVAALEREKLQVVKQQYSQLQDKARTVIHALELRMDALFEYVQIEIAAFILQYGQKAEEIANTLQPKPTPVPVASAAPYPSEQPMSQYPCFQYETSVV